MTTRTDAPPEMFANAPAPERVDTDGTVVPPGMPVGRVIAVVVSAGLLVVGVALWSVAPWLILIPLGATALVAGLALLAPKLASRRTARTDRETKKQTGGRWRPWRRSAQDGSRPSGRSRVFTGGGERGNGPLGRFRGPRIGPSSSPSSSLTPRAGAPARGVARLRQRLSPMRQDRHTVATTGDAAKARWSPFRRRRSTDPGKEGTTSSRWRLPGRRGSSSSTRAGNALPGRSQQGRGSGPGPSDSSTTTRRKWSPSARLPSAGAPAGGPRAGRGSVLSALRTGTGSGSGHLGQRGQSTRGATNTGRRQSPGGTPRWRHPVRTVKDVRERLHRASKKPPEKQTWWQYWFAPTRPVAPSKRGRTARPSPKEPKVSQQPAPETPARAEGNQPPDPTPDAAPITPLSADDAGFPYVPPPVHGRGPTRSVVDGTADIRMPTSKAEQPAHDRSSAASAFDDVGPAAPRERSHTMVADDLAHYTSMVDTSTPASQSRTCATAADAAEHDGQKLLADAQGLHDAANDPVNVMLGTSAGMHAEADEMERTGKLRFKFAEGFRAKAQKFLNRYTSV